MNYSIKWGPFLSIENNNLATIPEVACIYEIWSLKKTTDQPLYKKYIGQTKNLRARLSQYFFSSEENRELYDFLLSYRSKVRFFEIVHDSDRKQIEKLLYEKGQNVKSYIYNQKCPEGDPNSSYNSVSDE